ncbi:MAG: CocE/NonD family hydrolase [Gemmataceae bacterium]
MLTRRDALALWFAGLGTAALGQDADPTRLPADARGPVDPRRGAPKTLNGDFPFVVPKTREEWAARRQAVREQVLVANGLWPLPEKTPLNAVVHGKIERDGYTIEKVFFASTPGHYVSGNLYRPAGKGGTKSPAVLFAHGHWANGRLHVATDSAAAASVKEKGEPDLERARYFMQAIPATLARLGFVVFQYDMVGVADSTAIPHGGGFTDAAAELRLQSAMGLQTWNSVRALDFVCALPDVDATKVGMTGASGGGTQTFILAAIDDRLAAAFPAVMVSTAMQGGCQCENCSYLRVGTGNVEMAAVFAPKPMALSAANDWTKDIDTKGAPELKALYTLLGSPDNFAARAWLEYGHQYNLHARQMMYAWFRRHLQGVPEAQAAHAEPPYTPVPPAELRVYDAAHPRPADELDAPRLRAALSAASDAQLAKLAGSRDEWRRVVGTAFRVMLGGVPGQAAVRSGPHETKIDGAVLHRAVIGRVGGTDAVPSVGMLTPGFRGETVVVWVHPDGKSSLVAANRPAAAALPVLAAGAAVLAPDVLGVGEATPAKPVPVDAKFAGYTFGYNLPRLAEQVRDVLTTVAFARTVLKARRVLLVGWGAMGPAVALARSVAGDAVARTAADLNRFRFDSITATSDPMLLPGAVKYGGLGAALALAAPADVFVHNHTDTGIGRLAEGAYDAAGAKDKLVRHAEKQDDAAVVRWLLS